MTAPAALYRRYRPDTFQDVIGQEHVTEPLMTALRKNRVNHAYLFSGPRGCGKTTSARILARCLNCEQGPTPTPCGVCSSCVELARGGSGSLDVIEIDAASHGGVDDARDLRERATFAPVRDRYKIFIIDEAHMVTSAGFNALLKIVEEPPEHIKFIFATTEPDKVIGTIRSRTHHYPFRLVPPEPLLAYLEQLCASEHVPVAPGVLSLVVRAGGGSVRDSLSVLDQLMAGAGTEGIDYELAVALLGYTHAALLDDVVDAMAAGDSGTVFSAVDRVIQTGHDPRRFVEDLLERFRDLIIVQALPDAAESILRGIPADQLARMRVQAQNLGAAELSRAADVTNEAFNEMTGATSPRLHLELLCARLMLPAADMAERGWAARVDRLERRLSFAHDGEGLAPAVERTATPVVERSAPESKPQPMAERPAAPVAERSEAESKPRSEAPTSGPHGATSAPEPVTSAPPGVTSAPPGVTSAPQQVTSAQGGGAGSVEMFRRAWPDILDALAKVKRSTWALVGPNASVAGFDGRTLALAFGTSGLAAAFSRADHSENLHRAIQTVLGVDCQIDAVTGGNGPGTAPTAGGGERPKAPADPHPGTPLPGRAPAAQSAPASGNAEPEPSASRHTAGSTAQPAANPTPSTPPKTPPVSSLPSAADVAWGLAPAPATPATAPASSPVPTRASTAKTRTQPQGPHPAELPTQQPGSTPETHIPEPSAPGASPALNAEARPRDAHPAEVPTQPQGRTPEAQTPETPAREARFPSAPTPAPAPSPYDDIPYSDEEPTGEWDEPYPEDSGYSAARRQQPPQPTSTGQPSRQTGPTRERMQNAGGSPASRGDSAKDTTASADPWSFARESTPGVWSVGTEPNVRNGSTPAGSAESSPTAKQPATPWPLAQQPAAAAPSYAPAAAQAPIQPKAPANAAAASQGGRKLSMYERLSQKAAAEMAQQQPQQQAPAPQAYVEEVPSADDETVEQSSLFGRAAVERILGGKLIEERGLDGSVVPPR
ncbi:DNA polymerase III subunit gamma and tau [Sinomonas sp. P10A9]|uniref:DNA polymerase III subunit gamma/tau n=1 Tax=Sinomonas puerhi TaxID=3238584 RepID=A0AB39L629_9MICC